MSTCFRYHLNRTSRTKAVATDFSDEALRTFVDLRRTGMTLIEVHKSLIDRNIQLATDHLLRIFHSSSLINLFDLQQLSNESYSVRLNPRVRINFFAIFFMKLLLLDSYS